MVVEEAGFDMMETYIWRRRNTVTQYIPLQHLTGFKRFHFAKVWGRGGVKYQGMSVLVGEDNLNLGTL